MNNVIWCYCFSGFFCFFVKRSTYGDVCRFSHFLESDALFSFSFLFFFSNFSNSKFLYKYRNWLKTKLNYDCILIAKTHNHMQLYKLPAHAYLFALYSIKLWSKLLILKNLFFSISLASHLMNLLFNLLWECGLEVARSCYEKSFIHKKKFNIHYYVVILMLWLKFYCQTKIFMQDNSVIKDVIECHFFLFFF